MSATTKARGDVSAWTDLDIACEGRIRIEASAGTGKTWTIAALYLRFILERGLQPRQIVVTTFTEVAAQELRERLRGALLLAEREALAATGADPAAASYETWMHARWHADESARSRDLRSLRLALAQLDIAPIGTLHGLCRRILAEHPFASGTEFMLPELVAGEAVLDEVVNDIWRILRQGGEDESVQVLVASGVAGDIEELRRALKLLLAPGVCVARAASPAQIEDAPLWARRLTAIVEAKNLIAGSGDGPKLRNAWSALIEWLEGRAPPPCDVANHLQLAGKAASFLKEGRASTAVALAAKFTLDQVTPLLENHRLVGLTALADLARTRLRETLARRNQLRFDDLLLRVQAALADGAEGAPRSLADTLHLAWPVALIDEFQDTDGVQFGILDAIYRNERGAQRGMLVMIGDPKQAIYRFRGGDIDVYTRAVAQAQQRLTLSVNRRSSSSLVAAVNEFYAVGGERMSAFAQNSSISYAAVSASDRCDAKPYSIGRELVRKPLVFHYTSEYAAKVPRRRTAALSQCANQIAAMLRSGEHRIGDRPITPADIAVLLPTAKSIAELRDLLRERCVPCATSDQTSVFRTDIARELQIVLQAIASPGDLGALRAAAATRLWGASFSDLQRYGDDLEQWQTIASLFHAWHGLWDDRGVMAVIELLIEHCAVRYLATPIGERAITDLRHLGELLQAEDSVVSGKEELLAWLTRQRSDALSDDSNDAADAAQLRIESDADRVRIMTLHLSKGLEFPIVFLPLPWDHVQHKQQSRAKIFTVHADGGRRVDVTAAARDQELRDLQDERFRVLYVALTRAIHACHVYALPPSAAKETGVQNSAFVEMLQRMTPALTASAGDALAQTLAAATPHIEWIDGWTHAAMQTYRSPPTDALPARIARAMPPARTRTLEAKHSFTTLTQFAHADAIVDASAADENDIDAGLATAEGEDAVPASAEAMAYRDEHPQVARLAQVRGVDIGNALHALLEQRDVAEPLSRQRELVARCLDEAGVRRRDLRADALVDAVIERVDGALAAPLGLAAAPQLCLGGVAAREQRAEMEFNFALDGIAMKRLREACALHGEPDLVPKSSAVLSGLMTGKIDLIFTNAGRFHVLDYKGNYLGASLADYSGAALRAAMDANHYRFQALIYTIATDRYLRQRLGVNYDRRTRLGECVYLFLRAAGLGGDAGIWRQRFDDDLIAAVDAAFAEWREAVA